MEAYILKSNKSYTLIYFKYGQRCVDNSSSGQLSLRQQKRDRLMRKSVIPARIIRSNSNDNADITWNFV